MAVEVGDGRTLFSLATKKEVVVAGKVGGAAWSSGGRPVGAHNSEYRGK